MKNKISRLAKIGLKIFRILPLTLGLLIGGFIIVYLLCLASAWLAPKTLDYFVAGAYYAFWGEYQPPDLEKLIKYEENAPAIGEIYDSRGRTIVKLAKEYRRINRFSDFPPVVVAALLSTEDKRFFKHDGIDYWVLMTSVVWDVIGDSWQATSKHRPYFRPTIVMSRGGSTITQQAVRLHLLSELTKKEKTNDLISNNWRTRLLAAPPAVEIKHVNTILRKMRELRDAIYTEKRFTEIYGTKRKAKEEIFARYASSIYLGSVYGIGYGSEFYFDRHIGSFGPESAAQAALLAGMIKYPLPSKFSLKREIPQSYIDRKDDILRLMAVNGYITESQLSEFSKQAIRFSPINKEKTAAPSVVGDILKELGGYGLSSDDVFRGLLNVDSTVNLQIQEIANQACENGLRKYEERHPENIGQTQCSVIVLRNRDAAILAEVGGRKIYQGRNYQYSDLNRVKRARQAGSAFKPFVYLTAFADGRRPDDKISDAPISISMGYRRGRHVVNNYDNKSLGAITLCEALYRSRNAPTVRLASFLGQGSFEESGMKKIIDVARLLGIKSPFHSDIDHRQRRVYYPTSALGASEINVMELANAYREIATGISAEPYMIASAKNRNGLIIFKRPDKTEISEIDPSALAMTRSCLRKAVTQPGGTAYSLTRDGFPFPVAGKTGTTDDFRNTLFVGWTGGLEGVTVAIRVDFDDNRPLGSDSDSVKETGAITALPIFKEIIENAYGQSLFPPAETFSEDNEMVLKPFHFNEQPDN